MVDVAMVGGPGELLGRGVGVELDAAAGETCEGIADQLVEQLPPGAYSARHSSKAVLRMTSILPLRMVSREAARRGRSSIRDGGRPVAANCSMISR